MVVATGVSQKGVQFILYEPEANYGVAFKVMDSFPAEAIYKCYLSIEVDNSVDIYQAVGKSLWYQGVLLYLPSEFRAVGYSVVANWRLSGVNWRCESYPTS